MQILDISRIINSFTSCLIFLVKHHSRKGGTIALVFFLHLPNYTIPRATLLKDGFHQPNGHIPIDSPSIRRRNSTWKVRRNYIDFERWIHVEIMTSIWRGNSDVDSTFKIDEISMCSQRGFFDVVSISNRRNFCTGCFHCIISKHFLLWEPILSYSGLVLSRCDFNNIDVITNIGTIGTISFGSFCNNATK